MSELQWYTEPMGRIIGALWLAGHLADRHRSIERVQETLIEYSNVIRGLAVAELSYISEG